MKNFIYAIIILFSYSQSSAQIISTSLSYAVKKPQAVSKNTPVLILLHGYGSNENDMMEMAKSFSDRFLVFSLRAPKQLGEGSYSWYDVEFLPDSNIKYSYDQVSSMRDSVLAFIRKACAAYKADAGQVFVLGFSQGAIMAYDVALYEPTAVKGLVALSGRMIEETKVLKTDWTAVKKLSVFIAHGTSDSVIKLKDSEQAQAFLKSRKVADLSYKVYDMPHAIKGVEIEDISTWLNNTLKSKKPGSRKK